MRLNPVSDAGKRRQHRVSQSKKRLIRRLLFVPTGTVTMGREHCATSTRGYGARGGGHVPPQPPRRRANRAEPLEQGHVPLPSPLRRKSAIPRRASQRAHAHAARRGGQPGKAKRLTRAHGPGMRRGRAPGEEPPAAPPRRSAPAERNWVGQMGVSQNGPDMQLTKLKIKRAGAIEAAKVALSAMVC